MLSHRTAGFLIVCLALICSAPPARGWAVNTFYLTSGPGQSTLYALDDFGGVTAVGAIRVVNVTDLAFSGSTLYGLDSSNLYQIDAETGRGSLVGPLNFSHLNALAASPATGALYAASRRGEFFQVDPATGAASRVGSFGTVDGGAILSAGALTFDAAGTTLYAAVTWRFHGHQDYLATINPLDGSATIIGGIGFDQVSGLAFKDGELFGVTGRRELLYLDLTTGAGRQIGATGIRPSGLAASPVPVPGSVLLLGSGLLCLVFLSRALGGRAGPSRGEPPTPDPGTAGLGI